MLVFSFLHDFREMEKIYNRCDNRIARKKNKEKIMLHISNIKINYF